MKKGLFLTSIIIIMLLEIIFTAPAYAAEITTDIMSEEFIDTFNPNKTTGKIDNMTESFTNTIQVIVNRVLGIIQVIGIFLTIIALVIFGYNILISANSQMADELIDTHKSRTSNKEGFT